MQNKNGHHPWNQDAGDIQHSSDFDYDAIDGHGVKSSDWDSLQVASEGLGRLLFWLWENGNFKTAFVKFVSMSAAMRPELLDDQSYRELAKNLDVTPAIISYNVVQFQEMFGVHFRRSVTEEGKEKYRAARLRKVSHGNRKFLGSTKRK